MNRRTTILLALLVWAGVVGAGEHEPLGGEMWQQHPNHLSVLVAGTFVDSEEGATFGLDYEYRLNERWGVGAVLERAFGSVDATTALAVADIHVWRGLAIQTGPGVERIDHDGETEEEFVYRIGALYEIERERYTLSPQLHVDITEETESVVVGVAFGWGF